MGKIDNIIKKLTEAPGDDLPKVDKTGRFKVGDVKISGGIKSTIKDINKETGGISWDIEYIPNFEELFDDATDLVKTAKGVYTKAKTDDKLRLIYDEARVLRNKIRTHIRNEYPDEYRKITMKMSEGLEENQLSVTDMINLNDKRVEAVAKAIMDKYDIPDDGRLRGVIRVALSDYIEENTTTGGGSASFTPGSGMTYATPYAFRRPKKKQKPIPENLNESKGAKNYFDDLKFNYQKAFRYLEADEKKEYKQLAKDYFSKLQEIKENLKEGIDLNSYGYSLVPKNKAGNYVQKGSKLDVKQLFEDQKDFQLKRVAAFDVIEQELNDIYKMLSNAKNETSEYYNDNPSSYTVIKPTDLVLDYIKDIKNLLKGE